MFLFSGCYTDLYTFKEDIKRGIQGNHTFFFFYIPIVFSSVLSFHVDPHASLLIVFPIQIWNFVTQVDNRDILNRTFLGSH